MIQCDSHLPTNQRSRAPNDFAAQGSTVQGDWVTQLQSWLGMCGWIAFLKPAACLRYFKRPPGFSWETAAVWHPNWQQITLRFEESLYCHATLCALSMLQVLGSPQQEAWNRWGRWWKGDSLHLSPCSPHMSQQHRHDRYRVHWFTQVEVAKFALRKSCRSSLDVRSYVDLAAYCHICHPWKMAGMQQWKYFALNFASLYFAFWAWNRATKSSLTANSRLGKTQGQMHMNRSEAWYNFRFTCGSIQAWCLSISTLAKRLPCRLSRKSWKMRTVTARQTVFSAFTSNRWSVICLTYLIHKIHKGELGSHNSCWHFNENESTWEAAEWTDQALRLVLRWALELISVTAVVSTRKEAFKFSNM